MPWMVSCDSANAPRKVNEHCRSHEKIETKEKGTLSGEEHEFKLSGSMRVDVVFAPRLCFTARQPEKTTNKLWRFHKYRTCRVDFF